MNKFLSLIILVFTISFAQAQQTETFKEKGYTLIFKSNYANLDPALKKRMVETFFQVYPKLANDFNKNAHKEVIFHIDTAYKGVAATGGGRIVYNPEWFVKHPGDIDVVTHEVMHIVQNYGDNDGPGWLTEGIADYVRFKYGVDNTGAKWSLTPFKPEHSYKNAYRITARFLNWLEVNGNKGIVVKLDSAMRSNTYKDTIWKDLTGKSLDELWTTYAANPGS
ncbi:basic secretory protein-like protein [Pedobacter boryungensis]|uniref:Secretory protein n=1 Tax=Pedobacter boryungensis TaxID=869962 RepID=A0ABX2DGA5_9SPHI|nr:basic secretory protein-like protein [Pedobacter boryungensis]NQX33134.1 secretory protein [Pedobacter boryungensis]